MPNRLPSKFRRHATAFTLLETLAAVAIIAVLLAVMVPQVANFVATAQRESDKRTLTVLNDALTRYKTEGGDVNALTYGAPIGNILQRMGQSISWNGMRHNVMQTGVTYPARSISVRGDKKQYEFIRYNNYVPPGDEGSVNTPTTTPGTNVVNGSVTIERWLGVSGWTIAHLTSNPAYIANSPSEVYTSSYILSQVYVADYYGQRTRGYLYPPYTGLYTFTLTADDVAEFWMSDGSDPSIAVQRISSNLGSTAYSCFLTAGRAYYFMILHKEHVGGDYFRLGWNGPNGLNQQDISSQYIGDYYGGRDARIINQCISYPANVLTTSGSNQILQTNITDGSSYQWYRNGIPIAGANTNTLSLINTSTNDNASRFHCQVTRSGQTLTSTTSTLTVYNPIPGLSNDVIEEYWSGISGSLVSDLTTNAAYIGNAPTQTYTRTSLTSAVNIAELFGRRYRGYIVPPVSGTYSFKLTSDDQGQFYLSTDTQPANKVLIVTAQVSTSSGTANLIAGQKYYFELLHKENGGGDYITLGWSCGDFGESAISSAFLDRYTP